jgi:hypothetical protein
MDNNKNCRRNKIGRVVADFLKHNHTCKANSRSESQKFLEVYGCKIFMTARTTASQPQGAYHDINVTTAHPQIPFP